MKKIHFKAKLWLYPGENAWCFLSTPTDNFDHLKEVASIKKRGFGSIKVEATIGSSTWKTSIFPDNKTRTYLLPVKKSVRLTEDIIVDDDIEVSIRLIELS